MAFIVITCDGGVFQGSVHAFDRAVCPGMARLGEVMLDAMWRTGIIAGMHAVEGVRMLSFLRLCCTCTEGRQCCERRAVRGRVNSDSAETVSEVRFHKGAGCGIEKSSGRSQYFVDDRGYFGRPHVARVDALRLQAHAILIMRSRPALGASPTTCTRTL